MCLQKTEQEIRDQFTPEQELIDFGANFDTDSDDEDSTLTDSVDSSPPRLNLRLLRNLSMIDFYITKFQFELNRMMNFLGRSKYIIHTWSIGVQNMDYTQLFRQLKECRLSSQINLDLMSEELKSKLDSIHQQMRERLEVYECRTERFLSFCRIEQRKLFIERLNIEREIIHGSNEEMEASIKLFYNKWHKFLFSKVFVRIYDAHIMILLENKRSLQQIIHIFNEFFAHIL